MINFTLNGKEVSVDAPDDTPLLWVLRDDLRLTDIIGSAAALKPGADTGYVLIRREDARNRKISVASANLGEALANPSSAENIALKPRDFLSNSRVTFVVNFKLRV